MCFLIVKATVFESGTKRSLTSLMCAFVSQWRRREMPKSLHSKKDFSLGYCRVKLGVYF